MELPSPLDTIKILLPQIFTTSPTRISPSLLSIPLKNSHYFLSNNIGPGYYQLAPINDQIESARIGITAAGGHDGIQIGSVGWRVEDGQISTRIIISKSNLSLEIILLWESEDEPAWKFLQLLLPGQSTISYEATLSAATIPRNIQIIQSEQRKVTDDRVDGGGSTPGAYGDAKDFWADYDEDEEEETSGFCINSVNAARAGTHYDQPVTHQLNEQQAEEEDEFDDDEYNSTGFCINSVNAARAGTSYDDKPIVIEEMEDSSYWNSYASSESGGAEIGDSESNLPLHRERRSSTITQAIITSTINGNGHSKGNSELEVALQGIWKLFKSGKDIESAKQEWKQVVANLHLD